jgi:hypothetical protein
VFYGIVEEHFPLTHIRLPTQSLSLSHESPSFVVGVGGRGSGSSSSARACGMMSKKQYRHKLISVIFFLRGRRPIDNPLYGALPV